MRQEVRTCYPAANENSPSEEDAVRMMVFFRKYRDLAGVRRLALRGFCVYIIGDIRGRSATTARRACRQPTAIRCEPILIEPQGAGFRNKTPVPQIPGNPLPEAGQRPDGGRIAGAHGRRRDGKPRKR